MIYLACPYSHPDASVRQQRFEAACRHAAKLIREGEVVFSPLSHSSPIADLGDLDPLSHAIWMPQNWWFVCHAEKVVVLRLEGWEESRGVQQELRWARQLGRTVRYDDPEEKNA